MENTRIKIVKELAKFRRNTSFYISEYWGSEEQIRNETEILNELSFFLSEDEIEIGAKETII